MATGIKLKRERMAGLRFAYLVRQLMDDGMSGPAIAAAIGCDPSLVSKWKWRGGTGPHDHARKGLRDDVMQGIFDGLGVRLDYLVMPVPRSYPNRVRLKNGETRPCEPSELDHKDFKVISNVEFEQARDRKEREQLRADQAQQRNEQAETTRRLEVLTDQVQQILAALGGSVVTKRTTR